MLTLNNLPFEVTSSEEQHSLQIDAEQLDDVVQALQNASIPFAREGGINSDGVPATYLINFPPGVEAENVMGALADASPDAAASRFFNFIRRACSPSLRHSIGYQTNGRNGSVTRASVILPAEAGSFDLQAIVRSLDECHEELPNENTRLSTGRFQGMAVGVRVVTD